MIEILDEENLNHATNVLVVEDKKFSNTDSISGLKICVFESVELDFSKMVKIGGDFRCSKCPFESE